MARRKANDVRLLATVLGILAAALGGCVPAAAPAPAPAEPAVVPEATPGERTITVAADEALGTCYNFWSVGNYNKPHALLDPQSVPDYREAAPLVTELNLVYLMGGRWEGENEWLRGFNDDGSPRTDFSGMIAQLRAAMDAGYTVRVVLDNVPAGLSDPPLPNYYGNTAPPADERVWGQYVEAAVRAMVEAFGREKVGQWSFRVGTEPDLKPAHWAGTKEQYMAHYDHTVAAVRRVLPRAIVGPGNILNPGNLGRARWARNRWGLDIIDHVAAGTNDCTGQIGAPMDVFSCSWYPRVGWAVSRFDGAMQAIRSRLDRYATLDRVTIEIGEFAVLGDERGRRLYAGDTTEWSASFYAALADRVYALDIRKLYEWDHATYGVMHPKGRVLEMLQRMAGGRRLAVGVEATSQANCGALACRKDDRLFVLLYNHRPERGPSVPEKVHLTIEDSRMAAGAKWQMSQWVADRDHSVWAYAFEADARAAGIEPLPEAGLYEGSVLRLYGEPGIKVFRDNKARYEKLSQVLHAADNVPVSVGDGRLTMDVDMAGHSVRLLELSPR